MSGKHDLTRRSFLQGTALASGGGLLGLDEDGDGSYLDDLLGTNPEGTAVAAGPDSERGEYPTDQYGLYLGTSDDTLTFYKPINGEWADITASLPGGDGTTDTRIDLLESGSTVGSNIGALNIGDNLSVTDQGDGQYRINADTSATDTRTDVSDSSGTVVPDTEDITFTASGDASVTVSDDGDNSATVDVGATASGGLSTATIDSSSTTSHTTSGEDVIYVDTSAAPVTITLASDDCTRGTEIEIHNISGANAVTVDTEGSETIDPGAEASKSIGKAGWSVTFVADDDSTWDSSLAAEFESVSTEEFDNVFHASAFDGADGGEQIQNAVDAAEMTAGYNAAVVGPAGPQNGVWETNSAIGLGDNTCLIIRGEIKRTAPCNLLKNKDTDNGNSNISVIGQGGLLNFNAANVTRQETLDDLGTRFVRVTDFRYEGVRHKDNHSWNTKFEGCSNGHIGPVWFNQTEDFANGDGVDINLPANDITIDGVHGTCSDDIIAINGVNGSSYKWLEIDGGTAEEISVSNVTADTTGNYGALKILTDAGNDLSNITANGISVGGGENFTPVKIGDTNVGDASPSKDEVRNIRVNDCQCDIAEAVVEIVEPCSDVHINADVHEVKDEGTKFFNDITVDGLTLNGNWKTTTSTGAPAAILVSSGNTVNNLRVSDLHVDGWDTVVNIPGTADGWINNLTAQNTTTSVYYNVPDAISFGGSVPIDGTARLQKTTDQSLSDNTRASINWDQQSLPGQFELSSNTLTVGIPGDYSISATIECYGLSDGDTIYLRVEVNGAAEIVAKEVVNGPSKTIQCPGFSLPDLSQGDTIEIFTTVESTDGGTLTGDSTKTQASISRQS